MAKKSWFKNAGCKTKDTFSSGCTGGGFYFLGFLGSFAFHLQTAPNLLDLFIGFLQSIIWPAFVVFTILSSTVA